MLTLNDGRSELWQWDTGRTLAVDADCSQVHFSNKVFGRSIDVDVFDGAAIIPDILLQTDKDLNVWAFVGTAENGYTKISKTFRVNRRNKPADYVFTPPDQTTLAELSGRLDRIEESQDPGAIKNAVDDYLKQNPVEAPVQSVNGRTGTVELNAEDVGAIAKTELPTAINTALAQAKASGEFDGADGAPGKDGADGQPGENGITPTIGANGNWYLGDTDTGKPSRGETGPAGAYGKSAYAYAVDGGYTGTEAEFAAKLADEMPTTLPNPNALTFTGAVTGSYDGSAPLSVEIPSGGGSGGSAELQLLTEDTLTEDTATIYVDGFSADRLAFAVAPYGSTANSGNVNGSFTFGFSDDSSININMNSVFVSNTASKAWNKHVFYATVNGNVLYILAKRETGVWDTNIDINILSNFSGALLKMVLLPKTVKITSLSIGLSSTGVIGANTQFKVVCA